MQRQTKHIALLVALTFFMENLDATIIVTALPTMAQTFNVMPIDLNIGISAYLLAVATFIPISGWLADRFGARTIFMSAVLLFTLASILCGLSTSLETFIFSRVLQGVGGAMMVPVGRLVVIRKALKAELVQAIAYITWPGLVAPIIGPALGGFIVMHTIWQWIFYINIPLGLAAIYASYRLIENTKNNEIGKFDFIGFLLLAIACLSIMYAMEQLGKQLDNILPYLSLGLFGFCTFFCAVFYMKRVEQPLLKFDAFKEKTFSVSIIGGSIFRVAMSAIPFLLPLLFQLAFGLSALQAGLLVLTVFVGNLAMKPFTTQLMRYFGFRKILIVNGVIGALTIASTAVFTPTTPWGVMVLLMFISGLSRSLQFTCYNSLSFADILPKDKRYAATQFSLFFQISLGVGVALAALILRTAMYFNGHVAHAELIDFQVTFIIVAVVSLLSLWDAYRLAKNAGDSVSGHRPTI
ncbi:DHA2 family efflux MFS transporter permease subunit [Acinetobacter nectaris]|uniref:DHA2 family efflux MFS transporter permease subunit n=1 Tax=Acinetobacter nectaris TaxID=1219382 RepID=UPI001F001D65